MSGEIRHLKDMIKELPETDCSRIHQECINAIKNTHRRVVVLDDDPTGTQAVHDIPEITQWDAGHIHSMFEAPYSMFFILTNSRAVSARESARIHREIANRLIDEIKKTGQDILLISRSDSTLRGHYPLETAVINEEWLHADRAGFDAEIIVPFFPEGGRYTIGDVHYAELDEKMIPAAETEYAKDRTFPYSKSNLCEWIEEKTHGSFLAKDVCSFSVEELRKESSAHLEEKLMGVTGFGKILVNAVSYTDLELFVIPLMGAIQRGKRFLFRSAASLTKILGIVSDRELLRKDELTDAGNDHGGLIVAGSHVQKTTAQLKKLCECHPIEKLEFDVQSVPDPEKLAELRHSLPRRIDLLLEEKKNVLLYTSRKRFDTQSGGEADLLFSTKVSEALSEIVGRITVRPRFILAKGGITSSDIATKSLQIKQAMVTGQILKGVPVWKAGKESKFPGIPYIIFPGNVGDTDALKEAYDKLL